MKKLLLVISVLFTASISAMDTSLETALVKKSNTGMSKLGSSFKQRKSQFILNIDGRLTSVPSYLVDPVLREANYEQMNAFNKAGCKIRVIKFDNGEFGLKAMVPGKAGGPITGLVAGWCVRAAMYSAGTASAAAVVTTNPAVGIPATLAVMAEYAATTEGAAAAATIIGVSCWFLP